MASRAYVDANVSLRVLAGDPPEMLPAVQALMAQVETGEAELVLQPLVVAEMAWVLRSFYRRTPGEIAEALLTLCLADGIEVRERDTVEHALRLYAPTGVDFIDAYLAACAARDGLPVCTPDADPFRRTGAAWFPPGKATGPAATSLS